MAEVQETQEEQIARLLQVRISSWETKVSDRRFEIRKFNGGLQIRKKQPQ